MPYGKRKTQRKRRKRYRRYKKPTPIGMPISRSCKLRYTEAVVLDVGVVGIISKYIFSANSLFDPNVSGTGHQPMTFDQISQFYNHYVVTGAKITVKAYSTEATSTVPNIVGIMLNDDESTPSAYNEVIEQRKARYTICNPSQATVTVSNTFSAKKFFNLSDVKDNVSRIGAPVTASPTDQAYFTLFALPFNSSTDTGAFNCVVTIDYIAQFSEPKDIPMST